MARKTGIAGLRWLLACAGGVLALIVFVPAAVAHPCASNVAAANGFLSLGSSGVGALPTREEMLEEYCADYDDGSTSR